MNAIQFGFMKGQTPFDNDVPLILDSTHIEFNPIQKHQVCGTGDNFVDNVKDEHSNIDVFDMEAYALAKVCHYYHIPFISFKYITDNVNEHSVKDWKENLADGIKEFKERVLNGIER